MSMVSDLPLHLVAGRDSPRDPEQRPMILIANLTAAELERYLGERIMDRLLESGSALVPFTWGSYRRLGRDV
jgi:DNA replication protein DnaC